MTTIHIEHLTKSFSSHLTIFDEANVEIAGSSFTIINGPSGSGKSTLLSLLLGLIPVSSGKILVDDLEVSALSERDLAKYRRSIGVVYQTHHLIEHLNLFENVAMPLWIRGYTKKQVHARVAQCLERMGLADRGEYLPRYLSGGEQQRGAIARATIEPPKLLLADEPSGNLDEVLSREVMAFLREYASMGTTVLVATHDAMTTSLSDRVIRINDRKLELN